MRKKVLGKQIYYLIYYLLLKIFSIFLQKNFAFTPYTF